MAGSATGAGCQWPLSLDGNQTVSISWGPCRHAGRCGEQQGWHRAGACRSAEAHGIGGISGCLTSQVPWQKGRWRSPYVLTQRHLCKGLWTLLKEDVDSGFKKIADLTYAFLVIPVLRICIRILNRNKPQTRYTVSVCEQEPCHIIRRMFGFAIPQYVVILWKTLPPASTDQAKSCFQTQVACRRSRKPSHRLG